jgi:hypothetical protein
MHPNRRTLDMTRTYTPEEKDAALQRLDANRGQVLRTSLQTGIPERTLQRWKALRNLQPPQPPPLLLDSRRQPPPTLPVGAHPGVRPDLTPSPTLAEGDPTGTGDSGRAPDGDYDSLRQHLVREALTIAASLSHGLHNAPLNQRAIALSRLVDRIVKLDTLSPQPSDNNYILIYDEGAAVEDVVD